MLLISFFNHICIRRIFFCSPKNHLLFLFFSYCVQATARHFVGRGWTSLFIVILELLLCFLFKFIYIFFKYLIVTRKQIGGKTLPKNLPLSTNPSNYERLQKSQRKKNAGNCIESLSTMQPKRHDKKFQNFVTNNKKSTEKSCKKVFFCEWKPFFFLVFVGSGFGGLYWMKCFWLADWL